MATTSSFILGPLLRLEALLARMRTADRQPKVIEPYAGYATPEHLVLRGRVHANKPGTSNFDPHQGRLANARQMFNLFRTNEVGGAVVQSEGCQTVSDEEGYFTLQIPRTDQRGWVDVPVTLEATGEVTLCPVFVADEAHGGLIISDIDDTIMRTGAYSLLRNLWTTFTGNALSREVFSDAAVFLWELTSREDRPVYYVSSSPWNLFQFLNTVFERAAVVRGPMFLRDLGLGENKLITSGHGDHKGQSIDTILSANPNHPAILVGDTGQEDAVIYKGVIDRHQGRIKAVVLRTPGPGLDKADRDAIDALEETGVCVLYGRSFAGFAEQVKHALAAVPQPIEE